MAGMIPSSVHALHIPFIGVVAIAFVLLQVVKGKAYFGFPGDAAYERSVQPVSYWLVIAMYTFVAVAASYLEAVHG
jgi:hypothetical protein